MIQIFPYTLGQPTDLVKPSVLLYNVLIWFEIDMIMMMMILVHVGFEVNTFTPDHF